MIFIFAVSYSVAPFSSVSLSFIYETFSFSPRFPALLCADLVPIRTELQRCAATGTPGHVGE